MADSTALSDEEVEVAVELFAMLKPKTSRGSKTNSDVLFEQ